ncbi:NAD(P)/FAD-dependent oxidoreductase [Shimia sp. FJ5]|uniref:NAD(P)/FAD-dependent oxidoreductase n=1 Tax=Shimia sp. FJ5 TaxID=3079054 RepID=UPI002610A7D4|nr:FAD-dependent oxidoreductase [Shimia sp. FJ5]MDV4146685.1 FAD-dependent oxidoreductase [Shimia sp. FJ5]
MSFDVPIPIRRKIAIVGGGISGLAAAYLLAEKNDITLFEAEANLGGHARTVVAGRNGDQAVDTGFIVFNYANYPHLTAMFRDLDVPVEKSDMSFGATIDNGRVEYGLRSLSALVAQRRNLSRPGFYRMVRDIMRFNERAEASASSDDITIDELVAELRLGDWFRDYYLRPICGAIWSTGTDQIGQFPARTLVRFFRNHALMSTTGQHQWWTVSGGSREYVTRLSAHLASVGCDLRSATPVQSVLRSGGVVRVASERGVETFDDVIFACHSDQALRLLEAPTKDEKAILGAIQYQDNHAILHADEAQMPRAKGCWSSWVYKAESNQDASGIGVTYWMNRLQNIPESDPLFVTLNPLQSVREDRIYDQKTFRHPVFDRAALHAQSKIKTIQGENNTWFAGAYLRNGFHEDGFASAVRVARDFERVLQ